MNRVLSTTALIAIAGTAHAGGVERAAPNYDLLFEEGRRIEFGFASVRPDVTGSTTVPTQVGPIAFGTNGSVTENYTTLSLGYRADLNEQLSYAIILDQPYGADVAYPFVGDVFTDYPLAGSTASLDSTALTGLLRYEFGNGFSVHGGLKIQSLGAEVFLPAVSNYSADGKEDWSIGGVIGVAYERPDIALRVALTYASEIDHDVPTVEAFGTTAFPTTITEVTTPQSVTLDFQSGVAADTLVFGSIRWVDWTEFDITPQQYQGATGGSLVAYDDDTTTYELGVGRRFTENFSGAITLGYEGSNGGFSSNLGPTDGNRSIGIGGTYDTGNGIEISAGVRYIEIGDAETVLARDPGTGAPTLTSDFSDNSAVAFGMSVAYTF